MKKKLYFLMLLFSGILAALVISSVAWFSANSNVDTKPTSITSSDAMVLKLTIPSEYLNEDAYIGQTGIEYNGLDSPFFLTYSPVEVGVDMGIDGGYNLFCDITQINITPVISTGEMEELTQEEIHRNFTWRFGNTARKKVFNPETGSYEEVYYEKTYKNINGFLCDEDTNEPLRVYDYVTYNLKLYLYFLGEEGYSLLESTKNNISADYTFRYSDISYMWATFNITITMGIKDLYEITFNSKGGEHCESMPTTGGSMITLPKPEAPNERVFFGGWYDNELYNGDAFENNTLLEHPRRGNFTLYAKWEDKYKITFNSNGYVGAMPQTQYIIPGEWATAPNQPIDDTIYWTTTPMTYAQYIANPMPFDFDAQISEDITLYAVWREKYLITLHMDTNYGGYLVVDGVTYHDTYTFYVYGGDTIPKIYTPEAEASYLHFKKWSLKGDAMSQLSAPEYSFGTLVEGEVHLYAYYGL